MIRTAFLVFALAPLAASAQAPDHPVITEVFQDPIGLDDGPLGTDPNNLHQSFIELYLPTAAALDPLLDKDSLDLSFYEVEGDSSSSGNTLVNYRIDLPTFDLDASNGLTGLPRPPSGVVVIGWVDYAGNPPVDLAGTPGTRIGLIQGGITQATDFTFIALNGAQFTGTTNFPVPLAVSLIHMPAEATSGIIQNGSGAYLLVNRDDPGYVQLFDDKDTAFVPPLANADPALGILPPVLGVSSLLDGWATNNDENFDVLDQPVVSPTGINLDLELVLPAGGQYSRIVPQLVAAPGHERLFIDLVAKTTEDALPANDDPVADATLVYANQSRTGPLGFPSPGRAHFSTSPPALAVGTNPVQVFDVLSGTTGRPGMRCANEGGDFALDVFAFTGVASHPAFSVVSGVSDRVMLGQALVHPHLQVTVAPGTPAGTLATVLVPIVATNVNGTDPAVLNPVKLSTATLRSFDPKTGLALDPNDVAVPFQATALAAVHGLERDPALANEFSAASLASFVAANLGGAVHDERANGIALLDPLTDLSDPVLVDLMEDDMPDDPLLFINFPGAVGTPDLVTTVLGSAEVASGAGTYDDSFNLAQTLLRAVEFQIAETRTSGGAFVPTERVFYANGTGRVADPALGLYDVDTSRSFELALLDTNVQQLGTLETGATDDFGLVVEIGRTRAGATVVPGEFVFLSFSGGFEGADLDSLEVPPGVGPSTPNQTVIIYVDLDALDSEIGAETIRRLFVVDSEGTGEPNVIEAFSLHVDAPLAHCGDADASGVVTATDLATLRAALADPAGSPLPAAGLPLCNVNGLAAPACDAADVAILARVLATPTREPGVDPGCPGGGL